MHEELLLHLNDEKSVMEREWPHLSRYSFTTSRIKFGNRGIGNGITDPRHIEYEPQTVQQRIQYCNLVYQELYFEIFLVISTVVQSSVFYCMKHC
jgi:hypothetical protein